MRPRRRLLTLAVPALVAVLAAAGCTTGSSSQGATTTTAAATTAAVPAPSLTSSQATTPRVAPVLSPLPPSGPPLDVPLGADGRADTATWPDACSLLTDAQIAAIVPGAAAVTAARSTGLLFGERSTAHATVCTYRVSWEGSADTTLGTITVDLRTVASADVLASVEHDRRNAAAARAHDAPGLFADYGTKLGGATCFFDGSELECVAGTFGFWVSGSDDRPAPPPAATREDRWRNRVLAKVVALLAERMLGTAAPPVTSS